MRKRGIWFILAVVLIGGLIGSAMGEVLAYLIPEGVVKQFFLKSITTHLGPGTLDIAILSITLGFAMKINIMGVIGIIIAAYILKWVE
ncbi:MAG TPA: DUF4321 domain-containing protein [Caldithrix abyssi]|uniref:DUF4321 domain-containing protein n=1 Tax=Caldithrix abyssi TaxID=187145 RepID=A0A7V5PQ24_CALAY|nr:DUF4321 domain-containing protein [Caldithrix abyssi]